MKAPFIYLDGKKRYKKLFCISVLKEDLEKITQPKKVLIFLHVIKDGKKNQLGVPFAPDNKMPVGIEIQLDVLKEFVKEQYGEDDVYVDEMGITAINMKDTSTIDVYFEQY